MFADAWIQAQEQLQTIIADVISYLPTLIVGVVVALIAFAIARRLRRVGNRIAKRTNAPVSVETLLVNTIYAVALVLAAMVTLAALGVNVAALIAGLGVSGLVIGFALKDILENLLAGSLILIQRPFEPGQVINVSGHTGVVTAVRLRDTTIRNFENLEIIVPNRTVYTSVLVNYSAYDIRRREFSIGLDYSDDLRHDVQQIIDTIKQVEGVSAGEEPIVRIEEFGDSSINARVYYTVDQQEADYFVTHTRVMTALQEKAQEVGINIPYPHVTLVYRGEGEAAA